MIALVTGASSGIGRDIARSLAKHGVDLIITARRYERLAELKAELTEKYGVRVKIITADLTDRNQVISLYTVVSRYNIDILVNNAGKGVFGRFTDTSLDKELDEINLNITAFHILFKLFLRDFKTRNFGYILNVASSAGFVPGPEFSSYYASKAYVVRMTQAVAEELRADKSAVKISMLCPGPVDTEFMKVAHVDFAVPPVSSKSLAEHAVREMFGGRQLITGSPFLTAGVYLSKLIPDCMLAFGVRLFQSGRYPSAEE